MSATETVIAEVTRSALYVGRAPIGDQTFIGPRIVEVTAVHYQSDERYIFPNCFYSLDGEGPAYGHPLSHGFAKHLRSPFHTLRSEKPCMAEVTHDA